MTVSSGQNTHNNNKRNGDDSVTISSSTKDDTKRSVPPTARQKLLSKIPLLGGRSRTTPKDPLPVLRRPANRWSNSRGKASPIHSNTDQETTPLLPPLSVGRDGLDVEVSQIHPPSDSVEDNDRPSRDPWKILKNRIDNGDLLLSGISNERLQDRVSQVYTQQEQKIQRAINEIRNGIEFNLSHCLLAIGLYLAISVMCFNTIFEPEWTILDSCYFAMVTVTTVGYGDEVPTSPASIVFTCIYSCLGVAILGIALGILGTKLVDAQDAMASQAEKLLKFQVLSVFDPTSSNIQVPRQGNDESDALDCHHQHTFEEAKDSLHKPSVFRSIMQCLKGFVPLTCLMLTMAYWIGHRAGWTFLEIVYFMIVTATTVGYGDFTPKTDEEKLIALLFIPIAVGATGVWLGGVAHVIVESRSAKYRRDLRMKDLTQHDLDVMDRNHDGKVSRAEFLEFMLVAMNKIDQSLVEELRTHFDRLDVDGTGELTRNDLMESARQKLQCPTHKLQLAMYKQHLLEQAAAGSGSSSRGSLLFGKEWGSAFLSRNFALSRGGNSS